MRAMILTVVACAASVAAQTSPPPIPSELRARFGFLGPDIVKIGHGINQLRCVAGGGQSEILVEDPRRASIQVMTWNGTSLDSRSEPTDGSISGMLAADIDGDGATDLIILDRRGRLQVRPRNGEPHDPIDVGIAASRNALRAADLDGDGRDDVVVSTRDGLRIVRSLGAEPIVSDAMALDEGALRSLHVHDVDGDGAQDLVVSLAVTSMPIRIKRGAGDGSFGPWLILDLPQLHAIFPGTGIDGQPSLAAIVGPHRRVVEYAMVEDADGSALELTAVPASQARNGLPFAVGDLDGDGDADLAVALPERAALLILLDDGDRFHSRLVPTFAGVGGLAIGDLDGDGRDDLVVASPDEGALGWKSGTAALDAFPERLPVEALPVAVAVHGGAVYAVCRNERRDATVQRIELGSSTPRKICDLGRLSGDPLRVLAAELDGRDGIELAIAVPSDGLRIVTDLDGDDPRSFAPDAGFTKKMDDGALALTTGENGLELLIAKELFVRRFRFDAAGETDVLAQDNGPPGIVAMNLVAAAADGTQFLLDRKSDCLYRLPPDGPPSSVDVPSLGFTHLIALGGDAVLIGPRGVLRVPFGRGFALRALRSHEPPTEDSSYYGGIAADLDGDGVRELAMLDDDLHGLQILVAQGDRLERALAFPMFEIQDYGGEVTEPHELVSGDVDGDGRDDLIALCFDRLLLYRQEK